MPALIAFQCTLIVSSFQIDVILLNAGTETDTYRSLENKLFQDRLLLRCFLPLLQIQLL